MARPANLLDLIEFPNNITNFQDAMGVSQWGDHLEQGRLFLLTKYADTALQLGKCTKGSDLTRYAGTALHEIKAKNSKWSQDFTSSGWNSFNTTQIKAARYQNPMQLVKAALAIVTLELCIQARNDCTPQEKLQHVDQLYKDVRIVPAFWRLDGFDKRAYEQLDDAAKQRCADTLLELKPAVPRGRYILAEMAAGHHVTHPVAVAIKRQLASVQDFAVVTARRAAGDNGKGNVKSACPSFCLP